MTGFGHSGRLTLRELTLKTRKWNRISVISRMTESLVSISADPSSRGPHVLWLKFLVLKCIGHCTHFPMAGDSALLVPGLPRVQLCGQDPASLAAAVALTLCCARHFVGTLKVISRSALASGAVPAARLHWIHLRRPRSYRVIRSVLPLKPDRAICISPRQTS